MKNTESQVNSQDKESITSDFWSICPICGEDAVIKGDSIWMCTDCGAYCEDEFTRL